MTVAILPLFDSVICDTFNRPDQSGLGKTQTGQQWLYFNGAGEDDWAIVNGQAQCIANDGGDARFAVIQAYSSWATVSADFIWGGSTSAGSIGLAVRYMSAKSHFLARLNASDLQLMRYDGTSYTSLGKHTVTPVVGQTYRLRVSVQDTTFRVYLDDKLVIMATDANLPNGSGFGLRMFDSPASRIVNSLIEV